MVKDVLVKILQVLMLPGVAVAFLLLFARNKTRSRKNETQSE